MTDRMTRPLTAPSVTVHNLAAAMEGFKSLDAAGRRAARAFQGFADTFAPNVVGLRVIVMPHLLPGPTPSAGEDARRIVRHALACVTLHGKPLVDPGPAPGERTHAVVRMETGDLWVSPELYERLKVEMPPPFAAATEPLRSDVYVPVHAARTRARFHQRSVEPVYGIRP